MTAIFNFFGSILGYLLWALYYVFKNYGVAIIFFTIITKALMFPFSLKQQRSMAAQQKLTTKQQELQKKYGKDRQKYSEELQKLYDKEGVNPSSGCLVGLIPFPIMLGIFYSVIYPLSNTLHIAKDTIQLATDYVSRIPGVVSIGTYQELEIIRNFSALRDNLTMFSAADADKIDFLSKGFNFLGLDLLSSPQNSSFASMMWIIPALSLILSFGQQIYMQRKNKTMGTGQQGQGCMKVMMYALPLLSVYWAFIMPGAVGFYWVMSAAVTFIQTIMTNMFFSANHLTAKAEAQRAVTMELAEASVRPLPVSAQKQIADKIEAGNQQSQSKKGGKKSGKK